MAFHPGGMGVPLGLALPLPPCSEQDEVPGMAQCEQPLEMQRLRGMAYPRGGVGGGCGVWYGLCGDVGRGMVQMRCGVGVCVLHIQPTFGLITTSR